MHRLGKQGITKDRREALQLPYESPVMQGSVGEADMEVWTCPHKSGQATK